MNWTDSGSLLVWADYLEEQGVDVSGLRAWVETGLLAINDYGDGNGNRNN